MIWADRQRTDGTLRKFIDSNGNEQNVHIEEIEANITQNGTPVNSTTMNLIEKNIGTYGNDTYDNTATYEVGDRVTYLGRLYRCIEEIDTPEEFDNEKWDETSALEELNNIGTEVVDTLEGNERDKSPSVNIINSVLGALANLTTTAKDNLVNAINELKSGLGNKVDKVSGKGLSTNDFTTAKSNQIETNKTNIANLTPATSYSTSTSKPYSCSYINNLETYSTSEKKIGKWIDGKPLYRKVISQSSKNDVNLSSLNYNYLAIVYTRITIASTPHPYIRNPYYTSGTDYFRTLLVPEGKLIIETSHSSITNWTTVIEYTKTTD